MGQGQIEGDLLRGDNHVTTLHDFDWLQGQIPRSHDMASGCHLQIKQKNSLKNAKPNAKALCGVSTVEYLQCILTIYFTEGTSTVVSILNATLSPTCDKQMWDYPMNTNEISSECIRNTTAWSSSILTLMYTSLLE